MNIVLIGPYYPYRGGISDTNQELCETLKENGHHVDIITFKLLYPSIFFPGKTQYYKNKSKQSIKAQRILNSINPFNWINISKKINKINGPIVCELFTDPDSQSLFKQGYKRIENGTLAPMDLSEMFPFVKSPISNTNN